MVVYKCNAKGDQLSCRFECGRTMVQRTYMLVVCRRQKLPVSYKSPPLLFRMVFQVGI